MKNNTTIQPCTMLKSPFILIAFTLVIVFSVFVGLSAREKYLADPKNTNWWSLAFVSRDEVNNDFSLVNFGETRTFSYEVSANDTIIETGSLTLGSGNGQIIVVDRGVSRPLRISVWTHGDENKTSLDTSKKKEIYKR